MLHHVSVGVTDVERAAKFYDAVLGTLGYKRVMEFMPHALAYGETQPSFWVTLPHDQQAPSVGNGTHIAFAARSTRAVNNFHEAALDNGGTDNGAPGPRPDYGPDYYGAFVIDPDGNKIEAVLLPEPKPARARRQTRAKRTAKKSVRAKTKTAVAKKAARKTAQKTRRAAKRVKAKRR